MAAAANTDGPEKAIAEVQHIVKSSVASASVEEDRLFGHDLHLSTNPQPGVSAAAADDERSEAQIRLDAAEKVILRLDSSIPGSLVEGSAGRYLSAVDDIIFLAGGGGDGDVRGRATSLLKTAMSRLRKEFCHIISDHSANLDADDRSLESASVSMPSENSDLTTEDFNTSMEEEQHAAEERGWYSLSDDQTSNLVPSEVISELKEIADRMIAAGYQQELCQAYSSARQDFFNGFVSVLGVDQLSIEHARTIEWKTLQKKVSKWTRRLNAFVSFLLPREEELCDLIFMASDELKEEGFRKTAVCFVLQLLSLGEEIATVLQSPRKIFIVLDIYKALSNVLLDIHVFFSGDSEQFLRKEAEQIVERLEKMVRGTLDDFADAIRSKKLSRPRRSGQVHHLAKSVMNYIKTLVFYGSSLDLILYKDGIDGGDDSVGGESMFPYGQRMHLLMSYLECRIQKTSKFFGDDALKYIFLMNNVQYMVQKIKNSQLKMLLGDNWVRTRQEKIQQYAICYLRASWNKALSYLKIDGLLRGGDSSSVSRVALKERFKNFNLAFEEIWSTQTTWIVPDPQLRNDLRLLILTTVFPGYHSFVERFQPLLEGGQRPSKYIKYTPEDLENHLSDLFEGTSEKSKPSEEKTWLIIDEVLVSYEHEIETSAFIF